MDNIILIGYMACGKSSIGKLLARNLSCRMIDTDNYIEEREQKKISDIFAEKGEDYFRQLETQCIQELIAQYKGLDGTCTIFATGGGLPMRKENRLLLKKLGTVCLLKASKETIFERVKGDTTRPLLQCKDPMAKIEEMLAQRKDAYEEAADYTIIVDNKTKDEVAKEIITKLQIRS